MRLWMESQTCSSPSTRSGGRLTSIQGICCNTTHSTSRMYQLFSNLPVRMGGLAREGSQVRARQGKARQSNPGWLDSRWHPSFPTMASQFRRVHRMAAWDMRAFFVLDLAEKQLQQRHD